MSAENGTGYPARGERWYLAEEEILGTVYAPLTLTVEEVVPGDPLRREVRGTIDQPPARHDPTTPNTRRWAGSLAEFERTWRRRGQLLGKEDERGSPSAT